MVHATDFEVFEQLLCSKYIAGAIAHRVESQLVVLRWSLFGYLFRCVSPCYITNRVAHVRSRAATAQSQTDVL